MIIAPAIAPAKPNFPNEEEEAAPDDSWSENEPEPGTSPGIQLLVVTVGSKLLADVKELVGKTGMITSIEVSDSMGKAVLVSCRSKSLMQVF